MTAALRIEVAATSALRPETLALVRALVTDAFEGDCTDENWSHALGGTHVLLWADGEVLIGHASVVERVLLHDGRPIRSGFVEAVAVPAELRRQGHGHRLMEHIERVIRDEYAIGVLSTSESGLPLYRARGWQRWCGETYVRTPDGLERTPDDDDSVMVLGNIEPSGTLACDWRPGEVW